MVPSFGILKLLLEASLVILSNLCVTKTFYEDNFRKKGVDPGISSYSQNL